MPSQLNQLHLMEIFLDLDVLKMILDIFHAEPDLVKKTFYSNDLKVLCDILCQDLLDSDVKSRIMMILEVFERMIFLNCGVNLNATASALEILISSKEISPESKLFAERILQRCRCEE
ncbi:unnamed protein product [Dracunculus medinensis]|uniref:DUF2013 domain-containing protein n=1 Tax=Dracunculus medinensis TaxID=318479 RepID=A0A0N4UM68_DRAME|nr:unnamed protein product [Dracunculus medinensis]